MNTTKINVDIVSIEKLIFSGTAKMVIATGVMGEIGIMSGHIPFLTSIKPGHIRLIFDNAIQDIYYVSGGILEVQSNCVTILADTVLRVSELDEVEANIARENAKKILHDKNKSTIDIAYAITQLAQSLAQLQTIAIAKKKEK